MTDTRLEVHPSRGQNVALPLPGEPGGGWNAWFR
jgi:hypothetical protein